MRIAVAAPMPRMTAEVQPQTAPCTSTRVSEVIPRAESTTPGRSMRWSSASSRDSRTATRV